MEDQKYYIKISPSSIKSYVNNVIYTASTGITLTLDKECCDFTSFTESINYVTGSTKIRLSMSQIVTGSTNGTSLMTGLTIPILITQNTVDIGYYSVFDGAILQKDVITNFVFSAVTGLNSSTIYLYNTSDTQYKKFLSNSTFYVNWGDGTPIQQVTNFAPNNISHQYPLVTKNYKITLSGLSNFGLTIIEKQVSIPFTGTTIPNPNGTAYFIAQGGSWSGIPISYDYIFSGDSNTDLADHFSSNYTTTPFLVTGFTKSSLTDLSVYKGTTTINGYSYKLNQQITGTSGTIGTFYGSSNNGLSVSYNINGVDYYDFNDGTTVFVTKLSSYGYKFFNVVKT